MCQIYVTAYFADISKPSYSQWNVSFLCSPAPFVFTSRVNVRQINYVCHNYGMLCATIGSILIEENVLPEDKEKEDDGYTPWFLESLFCESKDASPGNVFWTCGPAQESV
jgi:hypothetical protein